MTNIKIRQVTGSNEYPQLLISAELKKLGLKKGDYVKIYIEDNRIIIERAKVI
ncbi:MAG: AbrB/MazE/SpoVT family DNA-binding domain-containing protein [Candidatus Odinarchaeota archaeon]|nr:AbrB/MazE/SpoVT family DNA-binding domain-containing protein [Candidatus Odinarchaeota archaeon]